MFKAGGTEEPLDRHLADEAGEEVEPPGLKTRGFDEVGREGVPHQLDEGLPPGQWEDLGRPRPPLDQIKGGERGGAVAEGIDRHMELAVVRADGGQVAGARRRDRRAL